MKTFVNVLLLGAFFDNALALGVRGYNSSSTHTSLPSSTASRSSTVTSMPLSLSSTTAPANASMCDTSIFQIEFGMSIYSGYSTNPALQCSCAVSFASWATTSNPPTRTLTRAYPDGSTTETITTAGSIVTTVVEYVSTGIVTVTGNFIGADGYDWPGTAQEPCCSSCTIAAQTVNLFYWPTPAIPSQATAFVNSNGYTFVSPSVYMGFTSLSAFDLCGNVGDVYTSTTFAFGPSELSTFGHPIQSLSTTTEFIVDPAGRTTSTQTLTVTNDNTGSAFVLNYRDLGQNCSTISGYQYLAGNPSQAGEVTYDPCHPTILLPSQVKSANPAWASCVDNLIGGFYDPPYALTSQGGLQPFAPSSTPATPAQTPQSDQAPSTTAPPVQPTTASAPPADPSTPDPQPPATSNPALPVDPSSTPDPQPPVTSDTTPSKSATPVSSNPAPGDPGTSNPIPAQPESISVQNPGTSSISTSPALPPVTGGTLTMPLSAVIPPSQPPVVVGSQTLAPGGSPITVSGTVLSLEPSGSSIVINGVSTVPLNAIPPSVAPIEIGSQILEPGGSPITVSGAVFSLQPSGGGVVVNGASTIPVASLEAEISSIISAPAVLGTQTLTPGGAITLGGTTYSLQPAGSNVILNGVSTIPLSSVDMIISSAVDGKIGSAIASIMGFEPTATTVIGGSTFVLEGSSAVPIASATGAAAAQFTGSASRAKAGVEMVSIAMLGILGGVVLLM